MSYLRLASYFTRKIFTWIFTVNNALQPSLGGVLTAVDARWCTNGIAAGGLLRCKHVLVAVLLRAPSVREAHLPGVRSSVPRGVR